ncbi:MAG: peptide-methionine (S)-S-oxide reductase MsrA [Anaerolineaceae bacterium]|nr:peptide-methionine (S)-S-oxide reductase MsrA [Anaerolineaceae bacterium]
MNEKATLGGGCFWCLEPVYADLRGVEGVSVGYVGGTTPDPSYEQVCTGMTGHAEVVQITFDPETISYRDILEIFFTIHDPTTPNRQGADVGSQYRSAIFCHNDEQKRTAAQVIQEIDAAGLYDGPVVTEVVPLSIYYRAEEYHHNYFEKNPYQGYCRVVIAPKLTKFRKRFAVKLKTQ